MHLVLLKEELIKIKVLVIFLMLSLCSFAGQCDDIFFAYTRKLAEANAETDPLRKSTLQLEASTLGLEYQNCTGSSTGNGGSGSNTATVNEAVNISIDMLLE